MYPSFYGFSFTRACQEENGEVMWLRNTDKKKWVLNMISRLKKLILFSLLLHFHFSQS